MAYGHAERNLALIRQLEAETRQLLATVARPDPGHKACLPEASPDKLAAGDKCPKTERRGSLRPNPAVGGGY